MKERKIANFDAQRTPWCYMPPEMHFDDPFDLKDAFFAFITTRLRDILADKQADFLLPSKNKFEKMTNSKGENILVPTALDMSFVYRGQTAFYEECLPTLYRKRKTELEILIERLRCCEFEEYLRQLPEVKAFEDNRFKIDYLGLAQHYGLQTDMIDLTNDLDVALFFAMCNMSQDGATFHPQTEDKEYIGYIYAVPTFFFSSIYGANTLYDGKLSVIGMQPFYRPGSQHGFGLQLEKGETLTGLLYSFNYTREDSERFYSYFDQGTRLWHEDEISRVAREISTTKQFSYDALDRCLLKYFKGTCRERKEIVPKLRAMGCEFKQESPWKIGSASLAWQYIAFEKTGGFTGINNIVQRFVCQGRQRKPCRDTQLLSAEWMLRLSCSGCKAPEDYASPFENYESANPGVWGYRFRPYTQAEQTKPNPATGKVDKWHGDWKILLGELFDEST